MKSEIAELFNGSRDDPQEKGGGHPWPAEVTELLDHLAVELAQRRDLLAALMKSPGPFYQYPDGHFQQDTDEFDESAYLDTLQGITVYEASGRINFDEMARLCLDELLA